jgi:glycosyltransferase involved in cell wall biosynthesis
MQLIKEPRKLKIAQVIDVYEYATNGAAISTKRFTDLLRKNGHTVIVVSTGEAASDKVLMKEFYPPVEYLKRVMQRMKFVFALPNKQLLQKTFADVDIVHNQFPLLLGMGAIRIAREMGKPIISTFHVQGEQVMHNAGLKHIFWTKLAYKFFLRYIYSKSDIVICPSEFAEQEIKRYGLKKPTVVISNGVPPEFRQLGLPKKYPDKFTILTVGRNAFEKRQELIIRAVAGSKYKDQIQLIILGDGPLRGELEEMSKKLLNGTVEFQLLPSEKVIEYYNSVDLYVHAAAVEVECMTAIEAMACGVPLLIAESDLSATKQFALNDKHLFKTVEELTEKIDYWFSHREELEQAKKSYTEFSKKYSIENSYKKLEDVYRQVLEMHEDKIPVNTLQAS